MPFLLLMYYLTTVESVEEAFAFILIQQSNQSQPQACELRSLYQLCRVTLKPCGQELNWPCASYLQLFHIIHCVVIFSCFLFDLMERSPGDLAATLSFFLFKLGGGLLLMLVVLGLSCKIRLWLRFVVRFALCHGNVVPSLSWKGFGLMLALKNNLYGFLHLFFLMSQAKY